MPYPVRYPSLDAYKAAGKKFGNIGRAIAGGVAEAGIDRTPSYFDSGEDTVGSSPVVMDSIPENQTSSSLYPQYKAPTIFQRIFAPSSSAQLDQMNFQSQMARADAQQKFQNQVGLMDHEARINSTLETMRRNLNLSPEELALAKEYLTKSTLNKAKQDATESGFRADASLGMRPDIVGNYKATLATPGINNAHTQALTTGLGDEHTRFQIEQPYLNELYRNREERNATDLRQVKNQEEFYRESMPYRLQQEQLIHFPVGSIVAGMPTVNPVTQEPYSYGMMMPAEKDQITSEPKVVTLPNGKTISTGDVINKRIPGSPAGFYNFGQMPTQQGYYPINRPTQDQTTEQPEERINPVTGKRQVWVPKNK